MTQFRAARPGRRGISLVEVFVVIGIVGILAGLILAGVQKALATAARANCQSNLRQLGIGLHLFHDTHNVLPSSGGWIPPNKGGSKEATLGWTQQEGHNAYFGRPDPSQPPEKQLGSWSYSILPFLECANAYQKVDYAVSVSAYHCTARRPAAPQVCPSSDPVIPGVTYLANGINPWTKIDYNANGLIIQCYPRALTSFSQITDGLSNTILLGEKSMDPRNYLTGGWYWDDPAMIGCNARTGTSVYQDRAGVPFVNNWGSAHSGAALFLFADGSVQGIPYGTSSRVMQSLLTPNGIEDVEAFMQGLLDF